MVAVKLCDGGLGLTLSDVGSLQKLLILACV